MIPRVSMWMVTVILVSSLASSGICHKAPILSIRIADSGTNGNDLGTPHFPPDLQMDRDIGDVPRTQVSTPLSAVPDHLLVVGPLASSSIVSTTAARQHTDIVQQQHVFRI